MNIINIAIYEEHGIIVERSGCQIIYSGVSDCKVLTYRRYHKNITGIATVDKAVGHWCGKLNSRELAMAQLEVVDALRHRHLAVDKNSFHHGLFHFGHTID